MPGHTAFASSHVAHSQRGLIDARTCTISWPHSLGYFSPQWGSSARGLELTCSTRCSPFICIILMAPISWHTVDDMTFHCFQQRLQNGTKVDQSPFWLLKLVYPWPQRPSLKLSAWYTWAAPALYFTPYIQLAFIVPADPCLLSTASSIGSHLLYLTALTFLSTYIIFVTGVRSVLLPSESLRSRQAPQLFYSCTIHYTVLGTEPAFEAGLKSLFNDQYGWCEFLTARRPSQRSWKWCRFLFGGPVVATAGYCCLLCRQIVRTKNCSQPPTLFFWVAASYI